MVEDADEKKLVVVAPPLKVAAPAAVSVPVKLAEEEIVCPLMRPVTVSVPLCVALPEVRVPNEAAVANRLVDDAVVAKRLVEVACDVVALRAVKLPSVDDAVASILSALRVPVAVMLVAVRLPPKKPEPLTESVVNGEVVPRPKLPAEVKTEVRRPEGLYMSIILAV
jgi:hypothetical protein